MMPSHGAAEKFVSCGPARRPDREPVRRRATGFSLIEVVTVTAIAIILMAIAIPVAGNAFRGFHLTASTTAIAGAIQNARYQAIMVGCPFTLTFSTTAATYQLATQAVSGTPPACANGYSNVGALQYWTTSGDVSLQSGATTFVLTFNPNGIVTATGGSPSCASGIGCLVLSNGKYTNTVIVSGVGNVTTTSP
jgi:Tfp pilus assembly protein FimT